MGAIRGQMIRAVAHLYNSPTPQTVAIGADSAQSTALNCNEVLIQATSACFILIDTDPTAEATTSHYLPAGGSWTIQVDPSHKVAVIQSTAGGFLYISSVAPGCTSKTPYWLIRAN